jgi:hypothetical protein
MLHWYGKPGKQLMLLWWAGRQASGVVVVGILADRQASGVVVVVGIRGAGIGTEIGMKIESDKLPETKIC